MGSLSQAKTLGGIGAILALLGIIPYAGTALVIVGWVLILVAIKYISDTFQDRSIYNNAVISIILAIVGSVIAGIFLAGAIFGFIGLHGVPSVNSTSTVPSAGTMALITSVLAVLGVLWILAIISSIFLRRSFDAVATKLNINLFRTGALIYLIGAILTIIVIGFLLLFVAQILFIIAFFSIPETLPPPPGVPGPPASTTASVGANKFCASCGARIEPGASFCPNCGASQPPSSL